MKKPLLLLLLFLSITLLSSCSFQMNSFSKSYTYFDSYEIITLWTNRSESYIDKYFIETNNILKKYHILTNRYEENKNTKGVYYLNHHPNEEVVVEKELIDLLDETITFLKNNPTFYNYFTIGIGSISDIWHQTFEDYNEASSCEKEKITSLPNTSDIECNTNINDIIIDKEKSTVKLTNGISLDLGGVVKGYVSKILIDYYNKNNLKYTIDMGQSNIYTNIGNPKRKNNAYIIGLKNPTASCDEINKIYAKVTLPVNKSIVTSGDYQKYFTYNDRIYSHILDKNTKEPVITNIRSVSIITTDPFIGDIYSTCLFMAGSNEAIDIANSIDDLECVIYTNTNEIFYTNGLNDIIEIEK